MTKHFTRLCFAALCALSLLYSTANAQTILLSEGFDNTSTWKQGTWPSAAGGWAFFVVPTGQTGWGVATGTSAGGFRSPSQYIYSQPYSNQLYAITPGQALTAGITYTFSYWFRNYDASSSNFNVKIYVGTTPTVAGMTGGTLVGNLANSNIAGTTYTKAFYDFTPTTSGTYYFGIYTVRISGTYVDIDDVLLTAPAIQTCTVPCNGWITQNCTTCTKGCYIDAGIISPSRTPLTASLLRDTSNYGYVYWTFNASADSTYYFDLCSSTGTAVSWLRLHNARNASPGNNYCMNVSSAPTIVLQNKSNGCTGTGIGLSKLIWTCQASGTYYLESAVGASMFPWGLQSSQTAVLNYKTLPSSSHVCADIFYDKGIDGTNGSSANYNNNENWIYTYYPVDTVADAINVQFISFSTSPGDILCVYDGNSINAPIIGCYAGPSITGAFTSTGTNGSLTFQFTSDDSLASSGWQANVSCVASLGTGNSDLTKQINIYPNPAKDEFVISGLQFMNGRSIEVYSALGNLVYSKVINGKQETINCKLPSGIYFIRIENESTVWNGRFVSQ